MLLNGHSKRRYKNYSPTVIPNSQFEDIDKSLEFYKYLGYEVVADVKEDGKFIDKILGLRDSDLKKLFIFKATLKN